MGKKTGGNGPKNDLIKCKKNLTFQNYFGKVVEKKENTLKHEKETSLK